MEQSIHGTRRLAIARLLPIVIGAILAAPAGGQLPFGLERETPAVETVVEPRAPASDGPAPRSVQRVTLTATLLEPERSRGELAIRGVFWGALVGGFLGYHEAGPNGESSLLGLLGGIAIGAPLGMVVAILTPSLN